MSETAAIIRFTSGPPEILKRIQFYLSGDTRPDFVEEVPDGEKAVLEALSALVKPLRLMPLSVLAMPMHE